MGRLIVCGLVLALGAVPMFTTTASGAGGSNPADPAPAGPAWDGAQWDFATWEP